MHAETLIDMARKTCSPATYNALAVRLGITRQVVHQWKTGKAPIAEHHLRSLCRMAGVDEAEWWLAMQADNAPEHIKSSVSSIMRKIGIAALLGLLAAPAWASGGTGSTSQNPAHTAYYVRLLERILDTLARMVYRHPTGVRHAPLLAL